MKIITKLRKQILENWKSRPEIIYLNKKDYNKYWDEIVEISSESINNPITPLWCCGIPVLLQGDKRTFKEIVKEHI